MTELLEQDWIKQLEEQKRTLEKQEEKMEELTLKQSNIIKDYLEKFDGVINWYIKNKRYFYHPSIRYHSIRGPILGFLEGEVADELIVYNAEQKEIILIDVSTKDEKIVAPFFIAQQGQFKNAINGLNFLLENQKEVIEERAKSISQMEEEIEDAEFQIF
ncbi:hypothetical protein ACMXZI_02815 [Bacillus subtilis]|uniref:Uncharacterized protein n=1 Tax=Bacillus subtilis TaxID=1423 RepID=A0AAQ3ETE6_BACIU|nr:hypothetical protein [Bacillus subtilis]WHM22895.1 hypothetical protein QL281_07645 [Bacillus subtilis]